MEKKYVEIKCYLLERIKTGEYKTDQAIPSERDLAALFGMNRMTVRRAIEELMYEGLLTRKKGRGTFLSKNKVSKQELMGQPVEEGGGAIKVVSCKLCEEGNYAYKVLNIEAGTPYWRLRRVRMLHMTPYAYDDIYFNRDFFSAIQKKDYELGLRILICKHWGDNAATVYEDVESLLCLHNTGIFLKVQVGSPILQIKSCFEAQGRVAMFCRSYHPGDTYKYQSLKTPV